MRHLKPLPALAIGVALAMSSLTSVCAEEQLVYWPMVTDGSEYRRVPYPREAGAIVVLADTEVVLEARRVPVSYWPITREYLANLSGEDTPLEGTVELVDDAGGIRTVAPTPYLTWYPDGVGAGPARLVSGDETQAFYDGYVAKARAAADKARQYQRIVAERQAAVEAWLKIAAERPPTLPKPPPELTIAEPEPYRAYASEPRKAPVTRLPAGRYMIRLRGPDGQIVDGSERALVSFAPRAEAIGYVVRPEDRWTRPIVTFAPNETIYTTDRTDLFLQSVPVAEYNANQFTRLFRPQSVEVVDPSLTVWVPGSEEEEQAIGSELGLWRDGAALGSVSQAAFRVSQLPGGARGYAIEEFEPVPGATLQPDFVAMRIARESPVTRVAPIGDGTLIPGSERQVRHVTPPSELLLFLPALLPLFFGATVHIVRRWRNY